MKSETVTLTLIDGPTLLLELGGLRILTDPTFDEPKTFTAGGATVRKLNVPPLSPDSLLPLDAILLNYTQSQEDLRKAFEIVGMAARFQVLQPAVAVSIEVRPSPDSQEKAHP